MENDKYFLFSPFNFPLSTSTSCYTNVPSANGWNIGPKQHQTKNISFTLTATCASPGASSTAGWTTWPKDLSPRRGTGNTRRYLGSQCTRLADSIIRLRQDRCRLRNGKHQLQTVRAGISLPELRHAYPLHRQWRKGQ